MTNSNSLHRLAGHWDRECHWNNSWGRKPSDQPPLEPHFHHLLMQESLMGFRGKYQTKARDSHTFHASHSVSGLFTVPPSHTQQDVKVPWSWWNWLVWRTIDRLQVASGLRIGYSWQPVVHFTFSLCLNLGWTLMLPCVHRYKCCTCLKFWDKASLGELRAFQIFGHRMS